MGYTIYYRTTRAVSGEEAAAIKAATREACRGRTWLSCEPVHFFPQPDEDTLLGGSKPNFQPHPDDAASAAQQDLPDGTVQDMLDILCDLSQRYQVDWEISDDHEPHIGHIREGECDGTILVHIEAIGELGKLMDEYGLDEFS